MDPKNVYIVDEIRAHHKQTDNFLVKWKNFGEEANTWEPRKNIVDKDMITRYEEVKNKAWKWEFQEGSQSPGFSSLEALWSMFDEKAANFVEEKYREWLESEREIPHELDFAITRTYADGRPNSTFWYTLDMHTLLQTNKKQKRTRQLRRVVN